MFHRTLLSAVIAISLLSAVACADQASPMGALSKMPVKEVTVFKDGHAFVLHQGAMPTDAGGNVQLDYLPTPVMGTFWPFSADKTAKLTSVVAAQHRVKIERTALTIREVLEGNVGASVILTDANSVRHIGTIASLPERSAEELEATSPPGSGPMLPVKSDLVVLKCTEGSEVIPLDRVREVTFREGARDKAVAEELRNLLTLKLDWAGKAPEKTADVGMVYLQRGMRWIPQYKITIDGKGQAAVKLQATLLNELTDLDDVTCNLVIGVPTFAFKDTVDPMALQAAAAQLSQYFREDAQTSNAFSNSIMTQSARMTERRAAAPAGPAIDLGPEIGGSGQTEDLFIFTVKHITLKKGQRMVLTVAEYTIPYRDVYVLDLAYLPPPEVFRQFGNQQQEELARLMTAPKAMHKIRLTNKGQYPLTTAPALVLRDDRVLAQAMMTYTSIGGETDLAVTTAVDIQVKKSEKEINRTHNAAQWEGVHLAKIDLTGKISLTNFRKEAVELEVVRNVLGNITEAGQDGKIEMLNVLEDNSFTSSGAGGGYPSWWGWYNWPYWWRQFNGVGRVTWKMTLEPGKSADLTYAWNYYWQ